jgi:hypothetical protein
MPRIATTAKPANRSGLVILKTGAETRAFADGVTRSLLGVNSRTAFSKLERGELSGTGAETEVRMLRDFMDG